MDRSTRNVLGKRAVTCDAWRWVGGMRDMTGERVPDDGSPYDSDPEAWAWCLPDLSDPATLGCLEHELLPEAWGEDSCVGLQPDPDGGEGWLYLTVTANPEADTPEGVIGPLIIEHEHRGATKAEALVAALEAAPRSEGS